MLAVSERLVFALDVENLTRARGLVALLRADVRTFKVGLELFTVEGPRAVHLVHELGAACFLDLKLHDIPETVERAVRAAVTLGVRYLTVHAAGGPQMLERAAAAAAGTGTQLLAITVLTSLDAEALGRIGMPRDPEETCLRLARLAVEAGVAGVVTSPRECALLRAELGSGPLLAVPGIRPLLAGRDDQKRVATPAEAVASGADLLIVGRPIRDAIAPAEAARAITQEIAAASGQQE